MANKTNFSADEWNVLLRSPGLTGLVIAVSSPNGPVGAVKESMAITRLIIESKHQSDSNELVAAVLADLLTPEGRSAANMMDMFGKPASEVKSVALAALQHSKSIVASKASADVAAWTQWLQKLSVKVSEAATEGGFFGFGGTLVNEAEKAALSEIQKALA
jgi:hypothetical protein